MALLCCSKYLQILYLGSSCLPEKCSRLLNERFIQTTVLIIKNVFHSSCVWRRRYSVTNTINFFFFTVSLGVRPCYGFPFLHGTRFIAIRSTLSTPTPTLSIFIFSISGSRSFFPALDSFCRSLFALHGYEL